MYGGAAKATEKQRGFAFILALPMSWVGFQFGLSGPRTICGKTDSSCTSICSSFTSINFHISKIILL